MENRVYVHHLLRPNPACPSAAIDLKHEPLTERALTGPPSVESGIVTLYRRTRQKLCPSACIDSSRCLIPGGSPWRRRSNMSCSSASAWAK